MFTADNTTGYTTDQLDALNSALKLKLAGVEPNSDEWHQIETALFLPFYAGFCNKRTSNELSVVRQ